MSFMVVVTVLIHHRTRNLKMMYMRMRHCSMLRGREVCVPAIVVYVLMFLQVMFPNCANPKHANRVVSRSIG